MLKIIYDNYNDDAVSVSATPVVPTMPVDRLRTQDRDDIMQTPAASTLCILVAYSLPEADFFAIISNLSALATVRQRLNDSDNFSGTVLSDTTIALGDDGLYGYGEDGYGDNGYGGTNAYDYCALKTRFTMKLARLDITPPATVCMFGRYDIHDPYNPNGVIWISRLYAANKLELSRNYSWGAETTCIDNSVVVEVGSYRFSDERSKSFLFNLNIGKIKTHERYYQLLNLWLNVGTTRYFIVIFDSTTADTTALTRHYVCFAEPPKLREAFVNQQDIVLSLKEIA